MRARRAETALWRMGPFGVLACVPGGDVVSLEGPAPVIWPALADWVDLDDLAADLAEAYGADPATVRADLEQFVTRLVDVGLAEVAP